MTRSNESKINNVVFYIAFCNIYLLTPLYYLFPQLSNVLPSSVVAGIPYAIMTVLIITSLIRKKGQVDKKVIGLLALIFTLLIVALFGNEYLSNIVLSTSFLAVSVFSLYVLIQFEKIDVYRHLSFVVLIIVAGCIYGQFAGLYVNDTLFTTMKLNYMSFGYTMSLMSMFLFEFCSLERKKLFKVIYMVIGIITASFSCVFGNRGALIIILIYSLLRIIKEYKQKAFVMQKTILTLFLLLIGLLVIVYRDELILELVNVCDKLGFESRTLSMLIAGNFEKSDRTQIYSTAFELLKENPFVIRGPGAMIRYTTNNYNAHNIVIELCVEYGIIIAAIILFLIIKLFVRIMKLYLSNKSFEHGIKEKISFSFILFMHSFIQLMFSSTLYECAGLWISICTSAVIVSIIRMSKKAI